VAHGVRLAIRQLRGGHERLPHQLDEGLTASPAIKSALSDRRSDEAGRTLANENVVDIRVVSERDHDSGVKIVVLLVAGHFHGVLTTVARNGSAVTSPLMFMIGSPPRRSAGRRSPPAASPDG
jgi:hypothetical protein